MRGNGCAENYCASPHERAVPAPIKESTTLAARPVCEQITKGSESKSYQEVLSILNQRGK